MKIEKYNQLLLINVYGKKINELKIIKSDRITMLLFFILYLKIKSLIIQFGQQHSYQLIFNIVTLYSRGYVKKDSESLSHRLMMNTIYYNINLILKLKQHNTKLSTVYQIYSSSNNSLIFNYNNKYKQLLERVMSGYNTCMPTLHNINLSIFNNINYLVTSNMLSKGINVDSTNYQIVSVDYTESNTLVNGLNIYLYANNEMRIINEVKDNDYPTNDKYVVWSSSHSFNLYLTNYGYENLSILYLMIDIDGYNPFPNTFTALLRNQNGNIYRALHTYNIEGNKYKIVLPNNIPYGLYKIYYNLYYVRNGYIGSNGKDTACYNITFKDFKFKYDTYSLYTSSSNIYNQTDNGYISCVSSSFNTLDSIGSFLEI